MRLLSVHRVRQAGCCKGSTEDKNKAKQQGDPREIRKDEGLGENSVSNARKKKKTATMGMIRRGAFAFENLNKF